MYMYMRILIGILLLQQIYSIDRILQQSSSNDSRVIITQRTQEIQSVLDRLQIGKDQLDFQQCTKESTCNGKGVCTQYTQKTYICTCNTGYTGSNCEIQYDTVALKVTTSSILSDILKIKVSDRNSQDILGVYMKLIQLSIFLNENSVFQTLLNSIDNLLGNPDSAADTFPTGFLQQILLQIEQGLISIGEYGIQNNNNIESTVTGDIKISAENLRYMQARWQSISRIIQSIQYSLASTGTYTLPTRLLTSYFEVISSKSQIDNINSNTIIYPGAQPTFQGNTSQLQTVASKIIGGLHSRYMFNKYEISNKTQSKKIIFCSSQYSTNIFRYNDTRFIYQPITKILDVRIYTEKMDQIPINTINSTTNNTTKDISVILELLDLTYQGDILCMRYNNNTNQWNEGDCDFVRKDEKYVECKCNQVGYIAARASYKTTCKPNEYTLDDTCVQICPVGTIPNVQRMNCTYSGNPSINLPSNFKSVVSTLQDLIIQLDVKSYLNVQYQWSILEPINNNISGIQLNNKNLIIPSKYLQSNTPYRFKVNANTTKGKTEFEVKVNTVAVPDVKVSVNTYQGITLETVFTFKIDGLNTGDNVDYIFISQTTPQSEFITIKSGKTTQKSVNINVTVPELQELGFSSTNNNYQNVTVTIKVQNELYSVSRQVQISLKQSSNYDEETLIKTIKNITVNNNSNSSIHIVSRISPLISSLSAIWKLQQSVISNTNKDCGMNGISQYSYKQQGFICKCRQGYTGMQCENNINITQGVSQFEDILQQVSNIQISTLQDRVGEYIQILYDMSKMSGVLKQYQHMNYFYRNIVYSLLSNSAIIQTLNQQQIEMLMNIIDSGYAIIISNDMPQQIIKQYNTTLNNNNVTEDLMQILNKLYKRLIVEQVRDSTVYNPLSMTTHGQVLYTVNIQQIDDIDNVLLLPSTKQQQKQQQSGMSQIQIKKNFIMDQMRSRGQIGVGLQVLSPEGYKGIKRTNKTQDQLEVVSEILKVVLIDTQESGDSEIKNAQNTKNIVYTAYIRKSGDILIPEKKRFLQQQQENEQIIFDYMNNMKCVRLNDERGTWDEQTCAYQMQSGQYYVCKCTQLGVVAVAKDDFSITKLLKVVKEAVHGGAIGIPIIVISILLVILTVRLANKDIVYTQEDQHKTYYPIWSINKASHPKNTRPTRVLLYWVTISSMYFAPAILFSWIMDNNNNNNIYQESDNQIQWRADAMVFGILFALIFSWFVNYVIGGLHYIFIRREQPLKAVVDIIAILTIITFFTCTIIATVMMENADVAGMWIICFIISYLLDTFVFDVLSLKFSKNKSIGRWLKVRGYFLDPPADETYPQEKVNDNL